MKFLGIDFGWQGKPSGLATLEWNGHKLRLMQIDRLTSLEEILDWIHYQAKDGLALAAIDAPIVIKNPAGMRTADRLMHCHFGKYHAGCYPANLGRPYAARTTELSFALEKRGFMHADQITPRQPGRYQIEVHPHAATVQLFNLQQIIKYKKGPLAERRRELARYRRLMLTRLTRLQPSIEDLALPEIPETGPALKELEDKMDAVLCAYIGAHWWYWGLSRNLVCGSQLEGYIVVPFRQTDAEP